MPHSIRIKRRLTGATGAPNTLNGGELAYNEVDKTLYYGVSASNTGAATQIIPIGGELYTTKVSELTAGIANLQALNTDLLSMIISLSARLP